MGMSKGRRRGFVSWFVEPYKQVRLGLVFLVLNFIFSILIATVFGYYIYDMYSAVSVYFKLSANENAVAMQKFGVPLGFGCGLIVVFVISTILASVRYTHEIYGPLVSIHRYLDDLLSGLRPAPIQLRESDQLKDLAIKLNSVAERLALENRAGPMISVHRFLDDLLAGKKPTPLKIRDQDQLSELITKLNQLSEQIHTPKR